MSISIHKVSPAVGAVVKDVDLSIPVPPETYEMLEGALAEHGVLVFRDQHLTPAQHVAFSHLSVPLRRMLSLKHCWKATRKSMWFPMWLKMESQRADHTRALIGIQI